MGRKGRKMRGGSRELESVKRSKREFCEKEKGKFYGVYILNLHPKLGRGMDNRIYTVRIQFNTNCYYNYRKRPVVRVSEIKTVFLCTLSRSLYDLEIKSMSLHNVNSIIFTVKKIMQFWPRF